MASRVNKGRFGQIQHAGILPGNKRPADEQDGNNRKKRVFGDITNRETNKLADAKKAAKKPAVPAKRGKSNKQFVVVPKTRKPKIGDAPLLSSQTSIKSEDLSWEVIEFSQESGSSSQSSNELSQNETNVRLSQELMDVSDPFDDVDTEHLKDPFQVALYAPFIFKYYKEREIQFPIGDYLERQLDLTPHMRAILVDWLVEVQENFELNHETLYLAVKLVDHYLNKVTVPKENLQLVGATSLFIACKFDERCPPILDDFLYICDDAYQKDQLITMERAILHAINFDLGIPLSYRFLRRYSKCARAALKTLTLARYILESSLMDYRMMQHCDSHSAAAALYLAMRMDCSGTWTPTLEHYSGYSEADILPLVRSLNTMVTEAPTSKLTTIRVKYSHRVFHEVALTAALRPEELS